MNPALVYTIEVRENGKTVQFLPAVQRSNTWAGRNQVDPCNTGHRRPTKCAQSVTRANVVRRFSC